MKMVMVFSTALIAFCLAVPGWGSAQHVYGNQLGLFLTPDGTGATSTDEIGAPVNVYLVLINPVDIYNGDIPFTGIVAFDCQLNFNPTGGLFLTGNALNGEGLNVGDVGNVGNGWLEFIAGFAAEVPAVDGAVLLVSLQFVNSNVAPVYVTLSPASQPAIEGAMAFVSPDSRIIEMFPASGDYDDPIFAFNAGAVPDQKESFGYIKSLYR